MLVNGKEVSASPFPVFVTILAEFEGDVVVLDKTEKELRRLKHKKHGFQELSGLTVDAEDNIYFVDMVSNQIYKSNSSCRNVLKKRVKQVNGPGHCGLAVVQNEVLVCECHNEGSIMVYNNQDLSYGSRIIAKGVGLFLDAAADCHGNLYAVDNANSCIQALDNQGKSLHSIGCGESGIYQLKCPCNVGVAKEYVYISDWVDASVAVFTMEGNYVTFWGPTVTQTPVAHEECVLIQMDSCMSVISTAQLLIHINIIGAIIISTVCNFILTNCLLL